jgi:predicted CXXCH cytochrome family protein
MKFWTATACLAASAVLWIGCNAASRHEVLSTVFDGVPPLEQAEAPPGQIAAAAHGGQPQRVGYFEHGPYAARLCNACHQPGASNALVAPPDKLCFKCHQFNLNKKYIHGPLASGGCLVCHDPHSSRYRYMLVSASGKFCLHCHQRRDLDKDSAHAGVEGNCTTCHDAHMSDKKYLLK